MTSHICQLRKGRPVRTVFVVMLVSWVLNAVMDSIDHAKGSKTLYELWHVVKFVSYAVPFGYICYLKWEFVVWTYFVIAVPALWAAWELTYMLCRLAMVDKLDDWVRIPPLAWLWGIRRED